MDFRKSSEGMTYIKGYYYHIYNRECNKERIFFNEDNYNYLLRKMKSTFRDYGVNIISYCLMPNHYHFLMQQLTDISLSVWLYKIFVGYSQAVNKQQKRNGTLFKGRPKHISIDKEEYLVHLMLYIHSNPVIAGLVSKPDEWQFSNYLDCIGKRESIMVNGDFVRQRFGYLFKYKEFMKEYQINRLVKEKIGKYLFD